MTNQPEKPQANHPESKRQQSFWEVRAFLATKNWYRNTKELSFDFEASIAAVAKKLGLKNRLEEVREAFRSSFDESCLTQVSVSVQGEFKSIPLIDAIQRMGIEVFIWTTGDVDWQKEKMQKTGIYERVAVDHIHIAPNDKRQGLVDFVQSLQARGKRICALVVDDKKKNCVVARELGEHIRGSVSQQYEHYTGTEDVLVNDFQFVNDNPKHNARGFLRNLAKLVLPILKHDNRELVIIFDFDGVLLENDKTIQEKVSQKLWELMQNKK